MMTKQQLAEFKEELQDTLISYDGDINSPETKQKVVKAVLGLMPEDIVFADDDGIVRYESIRDYLDDFKIMRNSSILKKMVWDSEELTYEMIFNLIKGKFIDFMSAANKRNDKQVKHFIEKAIEFYQDELQEKHANKIDGRIKGIPAYKITVEEKKLATDGFNDIKAELYKLNIAMKKFEKGNKFDLSKWTKAKSCKQADMESMVEEIRKISSISVPEDIPILPEDIKVIGKDGVIWVTFSKRLTDILGLPFPTP